MMNCRLLAQAVPRLRCLIRFCVERLERGREGYDLRLLQGLWHAEQMIA